MSIRALLLGLLLAACQPPPGNSVQPSAPPAIDEPRELSAVSFNIQFLGLYARRDHEALAEFLAPHDLVFVQELVAPPYEGVYPDGAPFRPSERAQAFFDAMAGHGFSYVLSPEDTGRGTRLQLNSSATEWFVAFYRADRIEPAQDLFTGYISAPRAAHRQFDRVPFAFGFRADSEDLVFISVHLRPGTGPVNRSRRAGEFTAIFEWIDAQDGPERDYVILGDMNIESCAELAAVLRLAEGYISLNDDCRATNTNVNGPRPYDHVMFREAYTREEIPGELDVIDLVTVMRPFWNQADGAYPGDPYIHNRFRQYYSDHHPIRFGILVDGVDDD
ncbi:hypothetical protein GCM10007420_22020 [Glycocaulis albus]|uniref:Endonuclease/exonuclease/phosphatase domain-containing protein n=2 Tax=Glycocaulis albus TaxID=1382801 RepID=A0ABQ1XX56_9PROT|nr:hypothetical protein GCM10007420_22020 [Glycocaulis albus]